MKCHFKHIYNELESLFSKLARIVSPFDLEIVSWNKICLQSLQKKGPICSTLGSMNVDKSGDLEEVTTSSLMYKLFIITFWCTFWTVLSKRVQAVLLLWSQSLLLRWSFLASMLFQVSTHLFIEYTSHTTSVEFWTTLLFTSYHLCYFAYGCWFFVGQWS
jgi:hypothetical protein